MAAVGLVGAWGKMEEMVGTRGGPASIWGGMEMVGKLLYAKICVILSASCLLSPQAKTAAV